MRSDRKCSRQNDATPSGFADCRNYSLEGGQYLGTPFEYYGHAPPEYGRSYASRNTHYERDARFADSEYQRSDSRILKDVCDVLTRNFLRDASKIEVSVSDGEVTLAGEVARKAGKCLAENLAECVVGVKKVYNHIRLTPKPRRVLRGREL